MPPKDKWEQLGDNTIDIKEILKGRKFFIFIPNEDFRFLFSKNDVFERVKTVN